MFAPIDKSEPSTDPALRSLAALAVGAEGRLAGLGGDRSFRRRLMEMGLLPGAVVRLIRRVDVGGVIEIEVRRTRLTLRQSEAAQVWLAADVFDV